MLRTCRTCRRPKHLLTAFHRDQRKALGRSYVCSACTKIKDLRRNGAGPVPPAHELSRLLEDPCVYCCAPATEIDHATPVSRGGTNEISNLVPSCHKCNADKRSKTREEFLAETG